MACVYILLMPQIYLSQAYGWRRFAPILLVSPAIFQTILDFSRGRPSDPQKNRLTSDDLKIRMPALARDIAGAWQNVLKHRRV
jgi:hypothetical protein